MFKALCVAAVFGLGAGSASAAVIKAVYTGYVQTVSVSENNVPVSSAYEFGLQGQDASVLFGTNFEMVFHYEVINPLISTTPAGPGYPEITTVSESRVGSGSITLNGVTTVLEPTDSAAWLEAYSNYSPAFRFLHVATFSTISSSVPLLYDATSGTSE